MERRILGFKIPRLLPEGYSVVNKLRAGAFDSKPRGKSEAPLEAGRVRVPDTMQQTPNSPTPTNPTNAPKIS